MSEPTDDLPRYTWTRTGIHVSVFRRTGLYGQDHIVNVEIPILQLGTRAGETNALLLPEVANAICEYLDRRDREREGEEQ